jgi:hypothetical protein
MANSLIVGGQIGRYTETYTTFSGADIVCTFDGVTIGTLSGITWSVTREKAPVYTMGSANPPLVLSRQAWHCGFIDLHDV